MKREPPVMRVIQNLPIKRKIVLVTVATCSTSLLLACFVLFWFQSIQFHRDFAGELKALAAIVALNCDAPLTLQDARSAATMLNSLHVQPHIVSATLLDANGAVFARFQREPDHPAALVFSRPDQGVVFTGGQAEIAVPIKDGARPLGTVHLRARFEDRYRKLLTVSGAVMLTVLVGSLCAIVLLSSLLQRLIANPIVALADVAGEISDRQDYSRRAPEAGRDEVGTLTRTFNRMLEQIQSRDTRLRESQQRFEVAVMGSSDGLWDWDLRTNTVYYSPRWKSMLGYAEHEVGASFDAFCALLHPEDYDRVTARVKAYLAGQDASYEIEFRLRRKDQTYGWILSRGAALRDAQGAPVRFAGSQTDINERKAAEAQLARLNKEFAEASRQAGMAEVATGVLHNVGNVLNSVNVSAGLVVDQVRHSRIASLGKAVGLLQSHGHALGEFLTNDSKGRQVPEFLTAVSAELAREQTTILTEMEGLQQNIEHIKQIVTMQQSFARVSGVLESLQPAELVDESVRLAEDALKRHHIEVVRDFGAVPEVMVDRHKLLQILVNLIGNAKDALNERADGRRLTLRIRRDKNQNQRVRIVVEDNGVGISSENLNRIFQHGFTTKKNGHGFGLHSGALAAREMRGHLIAQSDGPGHGAAFILELPLADATANGVSPKAA